MLEDLTDALVGLGRTLEVLVGTDLLADFLALFVEMRLGSAEYKGGQWRTCSGVTGFCDVLWSSSMVFWSYLRSFFAADEDDGEVVAEVEDFGDPLERTRSVSVRS